MCSVASDMGTDGKRAVASNDVITSWGRSFIVLRFSTNSKEFLHTRGLVWIKGLSMSLR